MEDYRIAFFEAKDEDKWDNFVNYQSLNGDFLQSRKFLNYHPKDRFEDCSLMIYENNILVGVCPACIGDDSEGKTFNSHSGSTYGGIIISHDLLRADKILNVIAHIEEFLAQNGFVKCILKQNNPLMNREPMDLLDFALCFSGFRDYKELDLYYDFSEHGSNSPFLDFSRTKKRQVKKCIDNGFLLKELKSRDELARFLDILARNLEKYDLKPYHSVEDLIDLKKRFSEKIYFWGADFNEDIVAVSMVFLFDKSKCVHTHYLAADPVVSALSPMSFIYYAMIEKYRNTGYRTLSWGITTEHRGVDINRNLTRVKEEFGSSHCVVHVYEKDL